MRTSPFVLAVALLPLVSACATVGPNYVPPTPAMPASFTPSPLASPDPVVAAWWSLWRDPDLDWVISAVSARNLSLQQAALEVEKARVTEAKARSALMPTVQADALGGLVQASDADLTLPGLPPGLPNRFKSSGDRAYLLGAGVLGGFEPDLFGHGRRQIEAAGAAREAADWSAKDAFVLISAEAAEAYVSLRGYQARRRLLAEEVGVQQRLLENARLAALAGEQRGLETERPRADLAALQASLTQADAEAQIRLGVLASLLDMPAEEVSKRLAGAAPPLRSFAPPVGLPSDLLRRRPDLRAAERKLAAATAELGVATADLYPRFQLTAGPTLVSAALAGLLSVEGPGAFAGGRLFWPIFEGGRGKLAVETADLTRREALLQYRQSVLDALRDANASLTRFAAATVAVSAAETSVDVAARSEQAALSGQSAGELNDAQALPARKALLDAKLAREEADTNRARALVSLFKGLGGGWEGRTTGP